MVQFLVSSTQTSGEHQKDSGKNHGKSPVQSKETVPGNQNENLAPCATVRRVAGAGVACQLFCREDAGDVSMAQLFENRWRMSAIRRTKTQIYVQRYRSNYSNWLNHLVLFVSRHQTGCEPQHQRFRDSTVITCDYTPRFYASVRDSFPFKPGTSSKNWSMACLVFQMNWPNEMLISTAMAFLNATLTPMTFSKVSCRSGYVQIFNDSFSSCKLWDGWAVPISCCRGWSRRCCPKSLNLKPTTNLRWWSNRTGEKLEISWNVSSKVNKQ